MRKASSAERWWWHLELGGMLCRKAKAPAPIVTKG